MMRYKLYNKAHDRELVHPKLGLWMTNNLEEARDMREVVCDYLRLNGWEAMEDEIVIKNSDTDEEIS